jgi:hypothetical protein
VLGQHPEPAVVEAAGASGCSFHQIGATRRISASSSIGSRSA